MLVVAAFALTLTLIVLAFVFAGRNDWLVLILMFIDLPVLLRLGVAEWTERSHA